MAELKKEEEAELEALLAETKKKADLEALKAGVKKKEELEALRRKKLEAPKDDGPAKFEASDCGKSSKDFSYQSN